MSRVTQWRARLRRSRSRAPTLLASTWRSRACVRSACSSQALLPAPPLLQRPLARPPSPLGRCMQPLPSARWSFSRSVRCFPQAHCVSRLAATRWRPARRQPWKTLRGGCSARRHRSGCAWRATPTRPPCGWATQLWPRAAQGAWSRSWSGWVCRGTGSSCWPMLSEHLWCRRSARRAAQRTAGWSCGCCSGRPPKGCVPLGARRRVYVSWHCWQRALVCHLALACAASPARSWRAGACHGDLRSRARLGVNGRHADLVNFALD
mmetsp:Transcript_118157/g.329493  ORF Transcript_118157/g.329493 Transcript_118157/m.329493 type:complete len:264 (-) Transcript_118157:124-915(-)